MINNKVEYQAPRFVLAEKFENLQRSYDLLAAQKHQLLNENKIKDEAITRLLTKYEILKELILSENYTTAKSMIEDEEL